jgi:plasmid rolling circle replication initiator protein Rep
MRENIIQYEKNVKLSRADKEKYNKIAMKKKGSDLVAFTYRKTNLPDKDKKAKKLRLCGRTMIYAENPAGGNPIPLYVRRCSLRLCPSCSWIRAHRIFQNIFEIITASDFRRKQFIFLTLTVKNCRGEALEQEIKRILTAWNKLTKTARSTFRRSFLGTFRALEITYNPHTKTYHPHLHAMAAVEPDYFKKSNKNYISQADLRKLWRDACGLGYLPQCRVEKVRNTTQKQIAEVAKYTVKDVEYINRPAVLGTLDPALKGKRLIAYGGLFKSVKARLKLPDEDDFDGLPRLTVEEIMRNPCIQKIIFEWQMGRYHVSLMRQSADPADWMHPDRLAAAAL